LRHATVLVLRALSGVVRGPRRAIARLHELRRPAGPTETSVWAAGVSHASIARSGAPTGARASALRWLDRILDLTADRRGAPALVIGLVVLASLIALPPTSGTAVGAARPTPAVAAARIAALAAGPATSSSLTASGAGDQPFQSFDLAPATGQNAPDPASAPSADNQGVTGSYAPDGTLLKPFAVQQGLGGIDGQVQTYVVQAGDTLSGIATKFGLKTSTLYWANRLTSLSSLHTGQVLTVPPTDGVLYTVREGDTIATIAATFKADVNAIVSFNGLAGDVVVIGETIMVPDGVGAAIPGAAATTSKRTGTTARCYSCSLKGAMTWPVDGWYFISQHYWNGHKAVDIASAYGTPVVAAASGKVVRTGWVGNGGYAIWISNGNGIWTTYNHLSFIGVTEGQYVVRGQLIGHVGSSGHSTGPHLHFEVWVGGPPYYGVAVNPLRYF
jgi:murein DD-endopeptidase MepM/ murein hydrolase activator NlpD